MIRLFVAAVFAGLAALPVAAQSWCSSSKLNPTEHVICRDRILGELDIQMSDLYARVKLPGQRDWLNRRNRCGADVFCIEQAYRTRIAALEAARFAPRLRPWCSSARLNLTEQTICNDAVLANLDAAMAAVYGAGRARSSDPDQVNWLRNERDACGTDAFCIEQAYFRRIIVLGERLRLEGK